MKILSRFESWNKSAITFWGFILIGIIGVFDFLTGYEYAFSVFYVLPISMIAWGVGPKNGYLACFVSAVVWFMADVSTGHLYSHSLIPYWNSLIRFSFFVIITFLLSALKTALENEKKASNTDFLTGASNSRYFFNIVQMEINRLGRTHRPFTVVYIDIDNFKSINDKFGHTEGDMILQAIVRSIKTKIRNTDLIARLGGDEFALFLPDTNQEAMQAIIEKINEYLHSEMKKCEIEVTLSMGVLTCSVPPHSINELIKAADNLMYYAKRSGKNTVRYSMYQSQGH